jgi:hypothetical protein
LRSNFGNICAVVSKMENSILFFCALIAVSSAVNLTETFFVDQEWPCIQECYSDRGFSGEIRLVEMVLPEFSLIFDICHAITVTQTCADQCNYTNSLSTVKPFEYLCDSATLTELQKHEVCYTDINNEQTKTVCGERCGGKTDEMAERLHHVMAHHLNSGTNASDLSSVEATMLNATVETCRWQKCYAKCSVDNTASLCRDTDPDASSFMRKIYEELGYAHYDDLKSMGLADVVKTLPQECYFMVEPSTLFDEKANTANPADINVEQTQDRNEEEFWKQRQVEEDQMWSGCLKKCAADLNYAAEMDRFDEVGRGGDYADQFLNMHTMCRANDDLRQCIYQCNRTSAHPEDVRLPDTLCDSKLYQELQAHEQCYSKSREAKADCQARCGTENGAAEGTSTATDDQETCRTRICRMRCHYEIVTDTCDETDLEAGRFMLSWFDKMRRDASFVLDGVVDRETMELALSKAPAQCHYFLNTTVTLFDENSSVRCSLTHTCTIFLLLFVSFSLFNGFF